ncbi:uncharacterized protein PAC_10683 [Phialocephala subalpina]|uniref:Transcription factor domain-containing protein n=1 Tax=Phialocephala subalpina TaxID=576137 RepID=A0A1L7X6Y2_9HELO|nr:uncharacterized protein PAC_10683 [Phialocephala subalpina]
MRSNARADTVSILRVTWHRVHHLVTEEACIWKRRRIGKQARTTRIAVKGFLPEADLSSNEEMQQVGKSLRIPLPIVEDNPAEAHRSPSKQEEEDTLPLLPDQQGQVQYIGVCGSPSDAAQEIDGSTLETLIDAYFEVVHSDFPVLHKAPFWEAYENWAASDATSAANPVWLCGLLCVLLLARHVVPISIPEEAERKWWRHVQTLLPTVFFASNIFANLTGTAVRITFAIGLHQDDVKHVQRPLGRELRKQLWWTLYAFEQMRVSSYDRPSAIEHNLSSVGCPNERIVGVAGHCPQDYMKWSQRLIILLGTACRILNNWDVFYTVASALIHVLDVSCCVKQGRNSAGTESQDILRELAELMSRQLRYSRLPGSMAKWATIVIDLNATADEPTTTSTPQPTNTPERNPASPIVPGPSGLSHNIRRIDQNSHIDTGSTDLAIPYPYPSPNDGFSYKAPTPGREHAHQFWVQLSFMDDLNVQSQDWTWDDIDAILRGSEQQLGPRR